MRSTLFLLSISILAACAAPGGVQESNAAERAVAGVRIPEGTRLRIVASNLSSGRFGTYDGPGERILAALDPDLILLQEFDIEAGDEAREAFLEEALGFDVDLYCEPASIVPNCVASRFPIRVAGSWRDPYTRTRDFVWARIDVPGERDVFAVSVHFLTEGSRTRLGETEAVLQEIARNTTDDDYVVFGGDLNTRSLGELSLQRLDDRFDVYGRRPTDPSGDGTTNATRRYYYDHVLVGEDLGQRQVPTRLGNDAFDNGLVFDTRTHPNLDALFPARRGDSGAFQMQHMAVVRDFALPDELAPEPEPEPEPNPEPEPTTASLLINEFLANEPGGDTSAEFIEIVSQGNGPVSLTGFTIEDDWGLRHRFGQTSLAPGEAVVVHAGRAPWPSSAEAIVASSGSLGLNNGGDQIVLRDEEGQVVDAVSYDADLASEDGVSANRGVDANEQASFVRHTEIASTPTSPGTRTSGLPF